MAKKQKKESGKGRLRVFFAEFEGDDETIQEGLRAISSAVNKTFQPRVVNIPIPSQNGEQELLEQSDFSDELPDDEDVIDVPESSRPQQKRKPPTMSLVKDLNLRPTGKKSLRDFYAEKSPSSQQKQIAVFVYYLQHELQLEGITSNHVFTCFKNVEARPPKDLPQIIRNTAAKEAWVDSSDTTSITITNHGENFVEHDLPESKKN